MRFVIFCHSLASDWNHGNAHFLRGVCAELLARGHEVEVHEPADGWSRRNLIADHGPGALERYRVPYPKLDSRCYGADGPDLERILAAADVVLVHEWSDRALVARIGAMRQRGARWRLFFHDTHHRAASAPHEMAAYDLSGYDGVLAFGGAIRELYLRRRWARRAWTWHEAADHRVFAPRPDAPKDLDLCWVGNWGDDERSAELREFLIGPAARLGLRALIHGVRWPEPALRELEQAGIAHGGYLPNVEAPALFARARMTVHVPRRPYARSLPGIPTIRVFEALACGIPLVTAPWEDREGLFTPGVDYLVARDGREMEERLRAIREDEALARGLAERGRAAILARHTCAHRVDELLAIVAEVIAESPPLRRRESRPPSSRRAAARTAERRAKA